MAGNPRDQWERLQVILQNRAKRGGAGGGFRFPTGGGGPAAALTVLLLGGYALSTAMFNGEIYISLWRGGFRSCHADTMGLQWTVVTEPSSTPE
jgi:hypothetical protein